MKFDLPLLIWSPNIKDSIIHTTGNRSGTSSAATGKQRHGDTHALTWAGSLHVAGTEFGKDG